MASIHRRGPNSFSTRSVVDEMARSPMGCTDLSVPSLMSHGSEAFPRAPDPVEIVVHLSRRIFDCDRSGSRQSARHPSIALH